jgi:large subunit ribosomal protein L10
MSKARVVSEVKLKAVDEIVALCNQYSVIGLVKLAKIGSPKIADLRAKLRGTALIRMAKKTIITRAFAKISSKPELVKLMDRFTDKIGPSALIFTNLPALKLRRFLDESKAMTRAKVGEVVDKDIMVMAGNTKIPPGPVISELQGVGLPTKLQDGTIWVQKDTTVVKAGAPIDAKVAAVLARLNIEPIEVLLDLYAAYENGEVIDKDMLKIDIKKYTDQFIAAQSNALKLSIECGFVTPENAKIIIQKAFSKARALAMKAPILIPEFMKDYLIKAQAEATAIQAKAKNTK